MELTLVLPLDLQRDSNEAISVRFADKHDQSFDLIHSSNLGRTMLLNLPVKYFDLVSSMRIR